MTKATQALLLFIDRRRAQGRNNPEQGTRVLYRLGDQESSGRRCRREQWLILTVSAVYLQCICRQEAALTTHHHPLHPTPRLMRAFLLDGQRRPAGSNFPSHVCRALGSLPQEAMTSKRSQINMTY